MPNLKEILNFEYENAYDFAYDLSMKKNYSNPKIYDANGDLTKRWYVYFSFRDPETGKLKRVTPFYGTANKFKTKSDRMFVLMIYKHKLKEILKRGYNPFEENSDFFVSEQERILSERNVVQKEQKEENTVATKIVETVVEESQVVATIPKIVADDRKTVAEALEFALDLKRNNARAKTITDYESKSKALQHFLSENHPEVKYVDEVTRKMMMDFLNGVLKKTSSRTRNNYRTELKSLFQELEENELIETNILNTIKPLKTNPQRNKTFSKEENEQIFEYLQEKNPTLLLYIKFIAYGFLRPIEVNRLTIGDINIKERKLSYKAKNKPLKTKIIPEILFKELPDLSKFNKDDFLFTPTQIGGKWEATEENRRDYYSKLFKKEVKNHFSLDKNHGLYSFRHTYITKLYRELVKDSSPFAAKSKLMLITGHTTMEALNKYLRDIDAELPEDYSEYFKED